MSKVDLLLPKDEALKDYWAAAWDAYILFNNPYSNVFAELRDHYILAIERLELDDDESWEKVDGRLLEHIMVLYLYGEMELDSDVFQLLYDKIDLKLKKRAMDMVGRIISNEKKDVEKEVVDRAVRFWGWRLEACRKEEEANDRIELSEFGWWMHSSVLSEEWQIDQAIEILNLCHHITPDHIVMDRLVELSENHPEKATEAFRLIVEYRVSDYGFYGWLDKANVLLQIVLKTNAKEAAIKIIHKLGAYGFNQFGSLLKEDE